MSIQPVNLSPLMNSLREAKQEEERKKQQRLEAHRRNKELERLTKRRREIKKQERAVKNQQESAAVGSIVGAIGGTILGGQTALGASAGAALGGALGGAAGRANAGGGVTSQDYANIGSAAVQAGLSYDNNQQVADQKAKDTTFNKAFLKRVKTMDPGFVRSSTYSEDELANLDKGQLVSLFSMSMKAKESKNDKRLNETSNIQLMDNYREEQKNSGLSGEDLEQSTRLFNSKISAAKHLPAKKQLEYANLFRKGVPEEGLDSIMFKTQTGFDASQKPGLFKKWLNTKGKARENANTAFLNISQEELLKNVDMKISSPGIPSSNKISLLRDVISNAESYGNPAYSKKIESKYSGQLKSFEKKKEEAYKNSNPVVLFEQLNNNEALLNALASGAVDTKYSEETGWTFDPVKKGTNLTSDEESVYNNVMSFVTKQKSLEDAKSSILFDKHQNSSNDVKNFESYLPKGVTSKAATSDQIRSASIRQQKDIAAAKVHGEIEAMYDLYSPDTLDYIVPTSGEPLHVQKALGNKPTAQVKEVIAAADANYYRTPVSHDALEISSRMVGSPVQQGDTYADILSRETKKNKELPPSYGKDIANFDSLGKQLEDITRFANLGLLDGMTGHNGWIHQKARKINEETGLVEGLMKYGAQQLGAGDVRKQITVGPQDKARYFPSKEAQVNEDGSYTIEFTQQDLAAQTRLLTLGIITTISGKQVTDKEREFITSVTPNLEQYPEDFLSNLDKVKLFVQNKKESLLEVANFDPQPSQSFGQTKVSQQFDLIGNQKSSTYKGRPLSDYNTKESIDGLSSTEQDELFELLRKR